MVAASTNKEIDAQIPNYPNLPPQLICQLHNVTMRADAETDEVYAQMTLQPLSPEEQKEPFLPIELGAANKQPINYFCKTLTASDTSTHGGFSVPRRAAEKVFPPLDFSLQPPAQELIAIDLHDNEWKFRHIFRGDLGASHAEAAQVQGLGLYKALHNEEESSSFKVDPPEMTPEQIDPPPPPATKQEDSEDDRRGKSATTRTSRRGGMILILINNSTVPV